ncbi:MAG: class I adenylate-forming enzyme family protein [Halioglobus sp.]
MNHAEALAIVTGAGKPHELIEVEMHGHPCRVYANAPNSLRELYLNHRSDECFIVYEQERYTFNDAFSISAKIAHILQSEYGIQKGDRVAIAMRNYPEWMFAFTAITSIGAVAVAVNALWKASEIEYGMQDCQARLIIADRERVERCHEFAKRLDIGLVSVRMGGDSPTGVAELATLIAGQKAEEMPEVDVASDDDATILYTSGSTGHPKGVVSSHRAILSALLSWEADAIARGLTATTKLPARDYQLASLLSVPLFHVAGLHASFLSSFRSQRKLISMYKWDVATGAKLIEQEQVALFLAPASVTGDLVEYARKSGHDLGTLLSVGGGGEPRAPNQVRQISSALKSAMPNTGWGMTETNAIGTSVVGDAYLERASSSGQVAPVLDIAVVDEAGAHLPPGERGELVVRGGSMFREYWNRPDANAESFTGPWFHTGDLAYIDEDGFLFIVGRIKDLVIRGGENIGVGEVEAALVEHEHVVEASVYAVPDSRLGEELGATLYVDAEIDEGELREFLSSRLAQFKIPRYIQMQAEGLPRIASGKVDKMNIRKDGVAAATATG